MTKNVKYIQQEVIFPIKIKKNKLKHLKIHKIQINWIIFQVIRNQVKYRKIRRKKYNHLKEEKYHNQI